MSPTRGTSAGQYRRALARANTSSAEEQKGRADEPRELTPLQRAARAEARGYGCQDVELAQAIAYIVKERGEGREPDEDVLRKVAGLAPKPTPSYMRESARLAERHQREYPPPSGRIIIRNTRSRTPTPASRSAARPREHRRTRSRATASRGDPDSELARACAGCSRTFIPTDSRQRYHDAACSNAARQRKHKAKARVDSPGVNTAAGGIMSATERDRIVIAPKRVKPWYATVAVLGQRVEVSAISGELGHDSRRLNGHKPGPGSMVLHELVITTIDLNTDRLICGPRLKPEQTAGLARAMRKSLKKRRPS